MACPGTIIREYSHCQESTSQMLNLWIQDPYCWLYSDELVATCQGKTTIKEFWFKLWHTRIFAAHELRPLAVPSNPFDTHLLHHIARKIEGNLTSEELRPWQTPLNTLSALFAKWLQWQETISFIIAHKYRSRQGHDRHILICCCRWTDEPILKTTDGHPIHSRNYCWGHATDPESALQIVLSGGVRPAAVIDEKNTPYHWCPSFYCRIDGSNVHGTVGSDSYVSVSTNTIQHTRRHSQVAPSFFMGWQNADNNNTSDFQLGEYLQNTRLLCTMM